MKKLVAVCCLYFISTAHVLALNPSYAYTPFAPIPALEKDEKTGVSAGYAPDKVEVEDLTIRESLIRSPVSITGCDAGLMLIDGQYRCKSLVSVKEGGSMADADGQGIRPELK